MNHYLDYLRQLASTIFLPYKEVKLINSHILHTKTSRAADVVIRAQFASDSEKSVLLMLDDVGQFIAYLEQEDMHIVEKFNAFKSKYALNVNGFSMQKYLSML